MLRLIERFALAAPLFDNGIGSTNELYSSVRERKKRKRLSNRNLESRDRESISTVSLVCLYLEKSPAKHNLWSNFMDKRGLNQFDHVILYLIVVLALGI